MMSYQREAKISIVLKESSMKKKVALVGALIAIVSWNLYRSNQAFGAQNSLDAAMTLSSSAFKDFGLIPAEYACSDIHKENLMLPLSWNSIPPHTKSFALICEDPDAGLNPFVHLIIFNINPTIRGWQKGADLAEYGIVGKNDGDLNVHSYHPLCPPTGIHRYFFTLYALNTTLDLDANATKFDLIKGMEGHILATAQLIGRYGKH
jgi:Raf kinase inhibitor-like YbhB/YbcL family protein